MVEKGIILTWQKKDEEGIIGGVQSQFNLLSKALGSKEVSWMDAQKILGLGISLQYMRYSIIDRAIVFSRYVKQFQELFDTDFIIADDCCATFTEEPKNLITVAQNPYSDIAEKIYTKDSPQYFEFGEFYTTLQKQQFKKSKKIVAVSNYMKEYCKKLGFEAEVIPNGVDTIKFCPKDKYALRDKYGIPKDKKVGVWVGSFHPLKYVFIPEIIKKFKDVFWVLCLKHETNYKPKLPNVKILQNIPHDVMPEVYNLADFYLSTSPVESCGLAAIESMACDIPIIATKTGYFWDAKTKWDVSPTDYGILVDTCTLNKYIEAVDKMLSGHYIWEPRAAVEEKELDLDSWIIRWKNLIDSVKKET